MDFKYLRQYLYFYLILSCMTKSVAFHPQGKPVAELQLTNTRAGIVRRPFDTSLSLSVQSLLLVDALQTFGPDHELLVASHRHVSVDSVSGSLRGGACASEPGSPAGSAAAAGSPPSQLDLSLALSSLSDTGGGGGGGRSFVSPTPDRQQSR
jgi:vacuolar protein sorting-associated protein 13D